MLAAGMVSFLTRVWHFSSQYPQRVSECEKCEDIQWVLKSTHPCYNAAFWDVKIRIQEKSRQILFHIRCNIKTNKIHVTNNFISTGLYAWPPHTLVALGMQPVWFVYGVSFRQHCAAHETTAGHRHTLVVSKNPSLLESDLPISTHYLPEFLSPVFL